jgi:hypothetical protein
VLGNYIGTNAAGSEALGNEFGVVIQAANNTVGGTVAAARNVISGNFSSGVVISLSSNSNKVQGNFIGTNAAGSADLGNGLRGVEISGGSSGNTIGGAVAGARNIISGNNGAGVSIGTSGTSANFVQGNFIGLDVTGTFAIGNNDFGVELFSSATFNLVGGSVAGRNVISGNGGDGVNIRGGATLNTVQANFIGTNAAGAADLGNGGAGVSFTAGANGNNLGGDVASVGNVISGNDGDGVLISGSGTDRNQVLNNFIGVAANKTSALGNDQNGVFIADGASRNAIEGNVIAHNADDGVLIGSNATIPTPAGNRNSVLGNSIFANGNLGIDLGPDDGVTTNDSNDPDAGPNDLLNKPVLTGAFLLGDVLLLSGTINTELSKTLRIELFSTPTLNAAGQAEGKTFLGFIETDTDASNTVAFSTFLQTTKVKVGDFLTATATDQNGNTSEFSIGLAIV